MKDVKLTKENMNQLRFLESLQKIADHDRKEGNEYGYEVVNQHINESLAELGLNRRVARALGWDF